MRKMELNERIFIHEGFMQMLGSIWKYHNFSIIKPENNNAAFVLRVEMKVRHDSRKYVYC